MDFDIDLTGPDINLEAKPTGSTAINSAKNKTAWIGPVGLILFDNFTVEDSKENFIKAQLISVGLIIRMIGNPYSVCLDCADDLINVHSA